MKKVVMLFLNFFLPFFRFTKTTLIVFYLNEIFKFLKNVEILRIIDTDVKILLDLNDFVQKIIYLNGYYEKNETMIWKKIVSNKKVVFDVGMNIGYYSLLAAKRVDKDEGKIFGFEPVDRTFKRAKYNASLNSYNNIILNKLAVTDKVGEIEINVGNNNNWGMSSIKINSQFSGKKELVKADTIDNFILINNINAFDVIKIDVEGAEPYVIEGMSNTLRKYSPVILIELLKENLNDPGNTISDIYQKLKILGYKSYKILNSNTIKEIDEPLSIHGLILFKKEITSLDNLTII